MALRITVEKANGLHIMCKHEKKNEKGIMGNYLIEITGTNNN
jgi:hypothetical protein